MVASDLKKNNSVVPAASLNSPQCLWIEKDPLCRIFQKPFDKSEMTGDRVEFHGIVGIINIQGFNHLVLITEK